MDRARQFSLAHLCLQILLAGLGFGLSRVLLRPLQSEDELILVVPACTCHGPGSAASGNRCGWER